jgi:hypothetical protein
METTQELTTEETFTQAIATLSFKINVEESEHKLRILKAQKVLLSTLVPAISQVDILETQYGLDAFNLARAILGLSLDED